MSAATRNENRLTAGDVARVDAAIRETIDREGMAIDTAHLVRMGAHAIGCSTDDLRQSELDTITARVNVAVILEHHPRHDREGWNGRESGPGYRYARDLWAESRGDGDEWGTAMQHAFAVAEVLYLRTGEIVDGYGPGPAVDQRRRAARDEGADPYEGDDDWPAADLWEALDRIAADDGRTAWLAGYSEWSAWLAVECDLLEAEGKDY